MPALTFKLKLLVLSLLSETREQNNYKNQWNQTRFKSETIITLADFLKLGCYKQGDKFFSSLNMEEFPEWTYSNILKTQ